VHLLGNGDGFAREPCSGFSTLPPLPLVTSPFPHPSSSSIQVSYPLTALTHLASESLSGPPRTGSRSGWPVHSPGTPRPTLPPMLHTCAHAHSRGSFPGQSTGAVGAIESHRLVQVTPVRVDFLTVKSTLQSVSEKISSADAEKKLKEKKRSRRQRKGGGKGQKSAKIGCGQPRAAHWPQRVAAAASAVGPGSPAVHRILRPRKAHTNF
jgi:hypothetical protein